ncbi:MAG: tetratricopeptide repeat protein [Deltaproteobacteria bacterium]|nr:tetratricopeptide repeat protein [Deltaproteobacteria bacterium]
MIDPNKKEELPVNPTDVCYRAFALMKSKQFAEAEKILVNNLAHTEEPTPGALYHSALGVLYKMQGEYKTAWRHYTRAEKLLPQDPALKIIMARLLIEQFSEYDQAIKRAKKVLEILPDNPVFAHQAYVTMGLAYARKGTKKKAIEALEKSSGKDFENFVTAKNIDFHLVEMCLRKGWGVDSCYRFMSKALQFAKSRKEQPFVDTFQKMLDAFETEYPSTSSG